MTQDPTPRTTAHDLEVGEWLELGGHAVEIVGVEHLPHRKVRVTFDNGRSLRKIRFFGNDQVRRVEALRGKSAR